MFDIRHNNLLARLMDAQTGLTPVPVTRWSAQLADSKFEDAFRLYRFADDRRRVLLLLAIGCIGNLLNLGLELHTFSAGRSGIETLALAIGFNVLPVVGLVVTMWARTPTRLEMFIVAAVIIGVTVRLIMLGLHPQFTAMWPAMMLGIVFVIYLFLPIRLAAAVGLTLGFSAVAPFIWTWTQSSQLLSDEFARGMIALAVANALGFIAANGLHRSQRMQFAQSLMLRDLLSTDSLTGIANRRRFDEELTREWRRCARSRAPLSLLMIDVDHFKAYNDHYGHLQGDACLRQVAQLLVKEVGRPGDLVARFGGEEFVVLLPGVGSKGAMSVADKLAEAIRDANIAHPSAPNGAQLTMSIGVATETEFTGEPSSLVGLADHLLYAAKAAGRDQIAFKPPASAPTVATANAA